MFQNLWLWPYVEKKKALVSTMKYFKMKLSWTSQMDPIPSDKCFNERWKRRGHRDMGKAMWTQSQIRVTQPQAKECLESLEAERGKEESSHKGLTSEGARPDDKQLDFGFQALRAVREWISVSVSHPVCGNLYSSLRKLICVWCETSLIRRTLQWHHSLQTYHHFLTHITLFFTYLLPHNIRCN